MECWRPSAQKQARQTPPLGHEGPLRVPRRRQVLEADAPRRRAVGVETRTDAPRPGEAMALLLGALSLTEPRTGGEVADAIHVKRGTVSTTLNTLAKKGEAKKASRGYLLVPLAAVA